MNKEDFIREIAFYIKKYAPSYNIKVYSPIIAQAILESAYGTSELAVNAHNYFGLKYRAGRCKTCIGIYNMVGGEQNADGSYMTASMQWCRFKDMENGVIGYFDFINISNYSNLKGVTDPRTYLERIKADGYATEIEYVKKLMSVIERWDLTQYDEVKKEDTYMSNSPLICYTKLSPNMTSPRKSAIKKITIHHMAGNMSIESCGNSFALSSRQASSNYGIGTDGRIGLYVEEKNRAWTSSNADNDNQAITIEVANDQIGGQWHVSDKAMSALIDLCADICKRNGIARLNYTGDKSGNLTMHKWFASTLCPGPYLESKFPYIAEQVNKKLGVSTSNTNPTEPVSSDTGLSFAKGDIVQFTGCIHYVTANASTGSSVTPSRAKITAISKAAKHPYHCRAVNSAGNFIGGVYGWVNASDVQAENSSATQPTTPTVSTGTKKPRTTAPLATDKYWIHTSNGGLNECIEINNSGSCLPNCFTGETKFITRSGIKTLKECVGKQIEVLSEGGVFRSATVKNFGQQEIYKLVLNNGSEYFVTGNHRWVVDKFSQYTTKSGELKKYTKRSIKTTLELNTNDYIPYEVFNGNRNVDEDGIRHGFIYGDGSLYNCQKQSRASLCGDKKEYMKKYFENAPHSCECANGTVEYYPYPKEYKSFPDLDASEEYLRGFIVGYIASDGCVGKDGSVRLDSAKIQNLEYVKDICAVIGIRTSAITEQKRKGYGEAETSLYHIYLCKADITEDMLLNPKHQQHFSAGSIKNVSHTRIRELIRLNEAREVYCVVEPETHTMVLADNVLTGQCVGYAWGRFYEFTGQRPKLSKSNAENWYGYTADGYQRSQVPVVGAVICWRKGQAGNSADGAGHVAIVEEVKSNGDVVTSNSAYSGTRFYMQTITKASGYSMGSGYTFQGFILPPGSIVSNAGNNTPSQSENGKWTPAVGDIVQYNGNIHYATANASAGSPCNGGKAKITKVYQLGKSKHPYHLVRVAGAGSSVYGWVDANTFTKA